MKCFTNPVELQMLGSRLFGRDFPFKTISASPVKRVYMAVDRGECNMNSHRGRWIDDVDDDYDSSTEVETRPPSESPQRRSSIHELDTATSAVLALQKQVELASAPYRFLLSGLPYKANKKNKVGPALFDRPEDASRYSYQVLYKGKVHTGKCLVETASLDAALDLVQLHGKKIGSREITISMIGAKPSISPTIKTNQVGSRPVHDSEGSDSQRSISS